VRRFRLKVPRICEPERVPNKIDCPKGCRRCKSGPSVILRHQQSGTLQSATANILNDRQRVAGRKGLSERVVEPFILNLPVCAFHSWFR
jgi:hypothetical protein